MKLAKFWARDAAEATMPDGARVRVVSRGWSNESIQAALQLARERAGTVARLVATGQTDRKRYLYGDQPLPEPVVHQLDAAVVTRNSYGALVLNTQNLMFVDIDREDPPPTHTSEGLLSGVLSSLFGKSSAPQPPTPPRSPVVDNIESVANQSGVSARIYKTAAGYRAMITNATFNPSSPDTEKLLRQFGCDPLYIRLCRMQDSFRARLTPKPWRANADMPPVDFPFSTPNDEANYRAWEAKYTTGTARFATCRYVTTVGNFGALPEFQELIDYHDRETRAGEPLPLA